MKRNFVTDLVEYKSSKERNIYHGTSRKVIEIAPGVEVGGARILLMAGPCSVESEEQYVLTASRVKQSGAAVIRGGIFKPRTSPYSFQGIGSAGYPVLDSVRNLGLPVVSEILDVRLVEEMAPHVDVFQVGTRNMFNYSLLKELGRTTKPILLKRAMMATVEEFLGAAEYILSHGNSKVILCERGIRSFDSSTRFCLDLASISVLREKSDLPIIVDPSHGTGVARYVESMSLAAIAAGADGLLIEVHPHPEKALSDSKQTISCEDFDTLALRAGHVANAIGRTI
jgi:3-deoxy-7-phosphoheptulonate synthase